MKAKLMIVVCMVLYCIPVWAQRNCGQQAMIRYLESQHPGTLQQIESSRQNAFLHLSESARADRNLLKTTEETIIPVIFHIVLDSSQIKTMGGIEGIESRINTQMQVINDDFNGRNADKDKVPSVWAPLFANIGISFGLAHVSPSGKYTPGYEIRYAAKGTSFDAENGAKAAKFQASGGLDGWDNTKYLNIWILNLKITGSTALGITAPPGFSFTKPELGIALNYLSFGSRVSPSQVFIKNFDLGRTLTHELGHYFYLWHTWGDDEGTCARDDGFSDTPLQADNSSGTPTFPRFDACTPSGNGIMFMNYMDYTDDISLYMFTLQQGAMVRSQLAPGGLSYSLSQNSYLVNNPPDTPTNKVTIGPNPTRDYLYLIFDPISNPLSKVIVMNMWGQKVIETNEQYITRIDLQSFPKGIYFVHCYFKNEIVKQKISLQ
ncbi:MAG: zinc-dependent metalloprotease [Chitinophagaceae bacterium]|nr:zinc-dependent metalloprotease [Chitinophagaceae bacterium]